MSGWLIGSGRSVAAYTKMPRRELGTIAPGTNLLTDPGVPALTGSQSAKDKGPSFPRMRWLRSYS